MVAGVLLGGQAGGADERGSRFVHLDEREPFYVGPGFAKLTTPMWVGEPDVDVVVLLSIDDMRDPEPYEKFLRPILNRLREVCGRAPVSIFTCKADPKQPRLRQFLQEGLSIEVHTVSHPCPLLRSAPEVPAGEASLKASVTDVVDCLANLNDIAGNRAVAYRMPCCDSRNTVSPRFFAEVFLRRTAQGDFLEADSSLFVLFAAGRPPFSRERLFDPDGRETFRKYVPFRNYALTIENYPYPFVIDRLIWELPAIAPSDWAAQNLQRPGSAASLADWKTALDLTVQAQGLYTYLFHPYNWVKPEQVVELLDYAHSRYGQRVRYLNCRDVVERLTRNLLAGQPLRSKSGGDNGVRLLDLNADGYLDVVIGNSKRQVTRVWNPGSGAFDEFSLPTALVAEEDSESGRSLGIRILTTRGGRAGLALATPERTGVWHFGPTGWVAAEGRARLPSHVAAAPLHLAAGGIDLGVRFRDLDGDGLDDLVLNNHFQNAVLWQQADGGWKQAPFALPEIEMLVDFRGADRGLRFVDLDRDGDDDLVFSNEERFGIWLFEGPSKGWAKVVSSGPAHESPLPAITRSGALNGVWFHSGAVYCANEFTCKKPDLVEKVRFAELLARPSGP